MIHTSFSSGFTLRNGLGVYTARLEIGVAVFFLISGFLLYRPFAAAHLDDAPVPASGRFWARRLLRIVPGYWLAFSVITFVLHADRVVGGWWSWVVYYGFGQIYSPSRVVTGVTQAWSLCTEMTFYLMLPVYAGVVRRRRHSLPAARLERELWGVGALFATSVAFRIWVLPNQTAGHSAVFRVMPDWLPANLDLFALGMLLAIGSCWLGRHTPAPWWTNHPHFPWLSWAAAGLIFVAVSHLGISRQPLYHIPVAVNLVRQALYGLFALFLLLPAVFGPQDRGALRRWLRSRPLVAVGVVSYGVYLWHQSLGELFFRWSGWRPLSGSFVTLTASVLTLALVSATLSYVLVERPALRLGHRRWGSTRPAGIAVGMAAAVPELQPVGAVT